VCVGVSGGGGGGGGRSSNTRAAINSPFTIRLVRVLDVSSSTNNGRRWRQYGRAGSINRRRRRRPRARSLPQPSRDRESVSTEERTRVRFHRRVGPYGDVNIVFNCARTTTIRTGIGEEIRSAAYFRRSSFSIDNSTRPVVYWNVDYTNCFGFYPRTFLSPSFQNFPLFAITVSYLQPL